jgi:hypothetical protein
MSDGAHGTGYLPGPWSCEDGGPARLQTVSGVAGLALAPGATLRCTTRRTLLSTMTVLGAPGEVYLLTHSALRSHIGLPTTARVERIDPITLKTLRRSPALAGGPMWPGGVALHRNGDLIVAYGRYLHRIDRDCVPRASLALPHDLPYNGFVVLDNGLVVTKNLSATVDALLTVVDPDTLARACADVACPEPSVARLSAVGNTVYVVGVRTLMRYHWSELAQRLLPDTAWRYLYTDGAIHSHGWDVVIDGDSAWFMDNGAHRYVTRMARAGVKLSANRLHRVSLADADDHQLLPVSGLAGGSVTNPPLVDTGRRIVVGHDAANGCVQAWRYGRCGAPLAPLWNKRRFGCASHLLLYPDSGHLVVNDYRKRGEEVVVLDIANGDELARVRVGGIMQGVVFPSPGWHGDLYWSSMGKVARVWAE